MDHARSQRYLAAIGVTRWRRRDAEPTAWAAGPVGAEVVLPAFSMNPVVAEPDPPAPVATTLAARPIERPQTPPPTPARPPAPTAMDAGPPAWLDEAPPIDEAWFDADGAQESGSDQDGADRFLAGLVPAAERAAGTPPVNPVASMDWPALEQAVAGCRACRLAERRHNTVLGVGDRAAGLMFVGEGPGQEEDLKGEPFVGRAGQLLDRMLAAVGLRREQVYIANVVKCRPPNNRNPQPDEAAACGAFLERQIALVAPRLLVALGGVAANHLLGTRDAKVGGLRGRLHGYGPQQIPMIVTYHPSYYLRSPGEKARGWEDLQRIMRELAALTATGPQ